MRREGWSSARAKGSAFSYCGSAYYGSTCYRSRSYFLSLYSLRLNLLRRYVLGATCTRGITFSLRVGAVRLE